MKLTKCFSIILFSIMLGVGMVLFSPSIPTYATTTTSSAATYDYSTETLTANTSTGTKYLKKVYGYAKDADGNALANRTIFAVYARTRYKIPEAENVVPISKTSYVYDVLTTDSKGYYSFNVSTSGYYCMYLPYDTVSSSNASKIINGTIDWPCNWIVPYDSYYLVDVRANTYVLVNYD